MNMAEKPGCAKTGCGCALLTAVGAAALLFLLSQAATQMPNAATVAQPQTQAGSESLGFESDKTVIPGLETVDIYLNLTNKGFTKTGPRKLVDMVETVCESKEAFSTLRVSIVGPTPGPVSYVVASGENSGTESTDAVVGEFFGYIATIPYDDATPEAAKQWVLTNINRNAKRRFGKVDFEITANAPRSRILTITVAK